MGITINLPNGIQQSDGTWTKEVELDEMTGEEEDILADRTRAPGGRGELLKSGPQRITEILARCTVRVGTETRAANATRFTHPNWFKPVWEKAFSNDRVFAIIRLRQMSLGDKFTFPVTCPKCGKEIPMVSIDLSELTVSESDFDLVQKGSFLATTPSGESVKWRFISGEADEEMISKIIKEAKSNYVSMLMYRRIVSVNGEKPPGGLDWVKRLKSRDRRYLANLFDKTEGGVDTSIQIVCDGCNTEFNQKLDVMGNGGFFFPSELEQASSSPPLPSPNAGNGPIKT